MDAHLVFAGQDAPSETVEYFPMKYEDNNFVWGSRVIKEGEGHYHGLFERETSDVELAFR